MKNQIKNQIKNQVKEVLNKRNLTILLASTIPFSITLSVLTLSVLANERFGEIPPLTDVRVYNPRTGDSTILKNCFEKDRKKFCVRISDKMFDFCDRFKGSFHVKTGKNNEKNACLVHSIKNIPSSDPTLYLLYFPEN